MIRKIRGALALLMTGVILFSGALFIVLRGESKDRQLHVEGVLVSATVTDVRTAGRIRLAKIQYEFDGSYEGSFNCRKDCPVVGSSIDILVDEDEPRRFVTASGRSGFPLRGVGWTVAAGAGILVLLSTVQLIKVAVSLARKG